MLTDIVKTQLQEIRVAVEEIGGELVPQPDDYEKVANQRLKGIAERIRKAVEAVEKGLS